MDREAALERLREEKGPWDVVVVGGGATGLGVAVDAASRGYRTLLLERHDFAKGTSSRSTKLVHGGVRYLKQGNVSLVLGALRERGLIRRNAPHVAHDLGFVIPAYRWSDRPFYGMGLRLYDRLAGDLGMGRSRTLSRKETLERLPTVRERGLRGGILYYDGQFDDARLAVNLAQTAVEEGAAVLNYAEVVGFMTEKERIGGVRVREAERGEEFELRARCVVNAAGVYADAVRQMENPAASPILVASQGSHIVLPGDFLPGEHALMVPKTGDGRVMFAIPWYGRVIVGTTDISVKDLPVEPTPLAKEVDFLMDHASGYLQMAPGEDDVLSVFSGLRPLVSSGGDAKNTSSLSRDHTLTVSEGGLVTIAGGKWTTYRKMAEDTVNRVAETAGLKRRPCRTDTLHVHGWLEEADREEKELSVYGSDAPLVRKLTKELPDGDKLLHPRLPYLVAEVAWAARYEMARTVEDVLARRTRALILDARASIEAASETARILAVELGNDDAWQKRQVRSYRETARRYLVKNVGGRDDAPS